LHYKIKSLFKSQACFIQVSAVFEDDTQYMLYDHGSVHQWILVWAFGVYMYHIDEDHLNLGKSQNDEARPVFFEGIEAKGVENLEV